MDRYSALVAITRAAAAQDSEEIPPPPMTRLLEAARLIVAEDDVVALGLARVLETRWLSWVLGQVAGEVRRGCLGAEEVTWTS